MPDMQKPMSDLEHLRQLDPRSLRDYLKDGNYGGRYQREDEEMMKIWRAGVEETRNCYRSLVARFSSSLRLHADSDRRNYRL